MDDASFLRAIIENPDDDLPRLVYADWLSEHEQMERAEFIRVQCELGRTEYGTERYFALKQRERELFETRLTLNYATRSMTSLTRHEWRQHLPTLEGINWNFGDGREGGNFRRGFVAIAWADDIPSYCRNAQSIAEATPLEGIYFSAANAAFEDLLLEPHFRTHSVMELHHLGFGIDEIQDLARCGEISRLRELNLSDWSLGNAGVTVLSESTVTKMLVQLALSRTSVGDDGLRSLGQSQFLSRLESLDLCAIPISSVGVAAIVDSSNLPNLRNLKLHHSQIGDDGIRALAESTQLGRLRKLHLAVIGYSDEAAIALVNSKYLGEVTELDLGHNGLGDGIAQAIASCPKLQQLRRLCLDDAKIGPEGAEDLATSPYLSKLRALELQSTDIGDIGARALAESDHLAKIDHLNLSVCNIGDTGAESLLNSLLLARASRIILFGNQFGEEIEKKLHSRFGNRVVTKVYPLGTSWGRE